MPERPNSFGGGRPDGGNRSPGVSPAQRRQTVANRPSQQPSQLSATVTVDQLTKASTSPESANEAIHQIPWNALNPTAREIAESMISHHSIYRRLPLTGGYCNPEVFDFLVCHPEMVIGLWQTLGFSQISLSEIRPGQYRIHEKTGTSADINVLYHDNNEILLYCVGVYQSQTTARPVEGEAFVIMQYRFTEDKNNQNRPVVITRLDSFIRLPNAGADLVGKVFAPMIGKIVDSNFVQTVDFVNNISTTMESNPGSLVESIQAISGVAPEVKENFLSYVDRVSSQAYLRNQGETVDYYLLPKPNAPQMTVASLLSRKGGVSVAAVPQTLPTAAANNPRLPEAEGVSSTSAGAPASTLGTTIPIPTLSSEALPLSRSTEGNVALLKPNQTILIEEPPVPNVATIPLPGPNSPTVSSGNSPLTPGTLLTQNDMEDFSLNDDMTIPEVDNQIVENQIDFNLPVEKVQKKTVQADPLPTLVMEKVSHSSLPKENASRIPVPTVEPTSQQETASETDSITTGWNPKEEKVTAQVIETPVENPAESETKNSKSLWKKPTFMNSSVPAPLTDATLRPQTTTKRNVQDSVKRADKTASRITAVPLNSPFEEVTAPSAPLDGETMVFPTDAFYSDSN